MTIQESMSELATLFAIFDNPKDKFVQLMDMARESASLTENDLWLHFTGLGCGRSSGRRHLPVPDRFRCFDRERFVKHPGKNI